ncbi:MAG TPA: nuclear transport factor 2 family protein [Gaiellales bacterium]|jgi:ketosteroid isomerase-like protein|nr:nuclear transport factor 2 family protein [Gaiellales bacterium]
MADTDTPDAQRAVVAVFEAWLRDDAAGVAALFADDGGYESPFFTETQFGREAIEATVRGGMDEIRGLRIPIKHLAGEGDVAICEASFLCEQTSGKGRLDFEFAMVVETRDGEITRLREYFDTSPLVSEG